MNELRIRLMHSHRHKHAILAIMQLAELETFVAVCRTGSLTAAAEELHTSQPALTRRIASLEKDLGVSVLERAGRRLVPTPAGERFRDYVEEALATLRDGTQRLREDTGGHLTVALVGTLANSQIVAALRQFHDELENWEIRLRTANSPGVSELVRQGRADIGLRYNLGLEDPHLLTAYTLHERLCAVGRAGQSRAPDAREWTWLVFPSSRQERDPYRRALADCLSVDDLTRVRLLEVDSLTAQIGLARAGFGCAVLPETSLEIDSSNHQLERLPGVIQPALDIDVITRPNAFKHQVISDLLQRIESTWSLATHATAMSPITRDQIG
ncbi:LysR family transcriptional regulator [Bacillus subtilis]|nr:LysR family transcriptional regulator [Bacillus subtilis]